MVAHENMITVGAKNLKFILAPLRPFKISDKLFNCSTTSTLKIRLLIVRMNSFKFLSERLRSMNHIVLQNNGIGNMLCLKC